MQKQNQFPAAPNAATATALLIIDGLAFVIIPISLF
jgi:hypothetical protein